MNQLERCPLKDISNTSMMLHGKYGKERRDAKSEGKKKGK